MKTITFGLLSFLLSCGPTFAQDATFLSNWYGNISAGNLAAVSSMISEGAELTLESQNTIIDKQQFLNDALPNFAGSKISFEVEGFASNYAVAVVCIQSGSDTYSTLDTFNVSAGQVTSYSQERFKNGC